MNIHQLVIEKKSFQRERNTHRYRVAILRERAASLKEENVYQMLMFLVGMT